MYLYVAYDEYDNAATAMMAHSPVAWEHVLFKDVAVKVSSVEVAYRCGCQGCGALALQQPACYLTAMPQR